MLTEDVLEEDYLIRGSTGAILLGKHRLLQPARQRARQQRPRKACNGNDAFETERLCRRRLILTGVVARF